MANFELKFDSDFEDMLLDNDFDDDNTKIESNMTVGPNADALHYIKTQRAANTVRKTSSDIKKFVSYVRSKNEKRDIATIPANELDTLISQFIMQLKKPNGTSYEPDTVTAIVR